MSESAKKEFAQYINQHKGILFKVVNSYCANKNDRQDLAQEIITTLWVSFVNYDPSYKFSTWMYRVALNVAISYYRKDKKHHDHISIEGNDIFNIIDDNSQYELTDEIKQLYIFISELDKLNKAIILLYLENESYESIAASLGISSSNVGTRISRIKQSLKQQFSQQES